MTPDDRQLFEALFCAVVASAEGDGPFNWGIITRDALNALSAIRAAEGEEATPEPPVRLCAACKHVMRGLAQYPCVQCSSETGSKMWEPRDTQSVRTIGGGAGTARDLTAEDTINGLRARLTEAEIRAEELKLELSQTDARCELLAEEKSTLGEYMVSTWGSLDRAESIIHALCDERARLRAMVKRLPALLGYAPKPSPRVLPAGHVPELLRVGMVLRTPRGKTVTVRLVDGRYAFSGDYQLNADSNAWPLAEPFEVPND